MFLNFLSQYRRQSSDGFLLSAYQYERLVQYCMRAFHGGHWPPTAMPRINHLDLTQAQTTGNKKCCADALSSTVICQLAERYSIVKQEQELYVLWNVYLPNAVATHITTHFTDNVMGSQEFITVQSVLMVFSRRLLQSFVHYGPNIYCFLTV